MEHLGKEFDPSGLLGAAQLLSRPAEEFVNHQDVETLWAIKASEHMEVYFNLLKAVDPKLLRLTPFDQQIFDDFQNTFKHLNIAQLKEKELKSEASKAIWRDFCNRFEGIVEDFNFATILRLDSSSDYRSENTTLVPRVQFYAIEISRNRAGLNDSIRAKFGTPKN